jgi:hypothetical protein
MKDIFSKILESLEKKPFSFTLAFLFILLTLLSFQGFDVCDEGWYLSQYQQIFDNPETVEYNFSYWLTGIIGGVWYKVFGGQILGFRMLTTLFILASLAIAYNILKPHLKRSSITIGLLVALFINNFGQLAFHYNLSSSFFLLLIVFSLLKGLEKKQLLYFVIAGLLTAINVFSRIPNIVFFACILIIPLQLIWFKESLRVLKQTLAYIAGALIGFLIVYLTMQYLGHLDIMKNSLLKLANAGTNSDSNHNVLNLIKIIKTDFISIVKHGALLSFCFVILLIFKNIFEKNRFLKTIWYLISFLTFAYLFRENTIFPLYFIGFIAVALNITSATTTIQHKNTSLLALSMMILLPLGSDGGIMSAGYLSLWLSLPMFFGNYKNISNTKFSITVNNKITSLNTSKKELNTIFIVLIIAYFSTKTYNISNEAYFDKGTRFLKTYSINSPFSKGIYTTKERAEIFNTLLKELDKHVKPNDYLLAYDNIPMVNYLTATKPYMYTSWVWVYDSSVFEKQLQKAEIEIANLPIIVRQKFETIGSFSPPLLDYMSESKQENYIYKRGRTKIMNNFLKRNKYQIIWSNPYFNIYKATKKQ